ncbi:MAG: hypothetical protein IKO27_00215 [Ruminococcus sp.]|nr:hypothetical protein [Ruminococcus sp.]
MEENRKCRMNWWAMLASLLTGILLGAVGVIVGKKLLAPRKFRHHEREGIDCCDYDFDDYYDDDLQFRDDEDNLLDDETDALSF